VEIHWYLVPQEGRLPFLQHSRNAGGRSVPNYDFFRQLAGAIDYNGYSGALLATGGGGHDAWTVASSLIPLTERMKFIIAQHPGLTAPLLLAQQAATFDHFSKGRLIINVVNGTNPQGPPYGRFEDHDDRYALADEYWGVWRRIMQGETVTFDGRFVKVRDARLSIEPFQKPYPELYFGGSSPAAMAVAAKHVDTYLTWGEPPLQAAEKIAAVRAFAKAQGRTLRYGLRINVIVRDTEEEAWAVAQWMYDRIDKTAIDFHRRQLSATDSVGQLRQAGIIGNREISKNARDLELLPNLWAGLSLAIGGPLAFTIVGDAQTVAERIREYERIGFDVFILSSFPLIDESHRVAEYLFPLLKPSGSRYAEEALADQPYRAVAAG
jgi:alkanesulfonate monooxygenase